jgi:nucleotide-binding universal stress UspA family protein
MTTFKHILVSINATDEIHPALDQAMELARHMPAKITVVDVLPHVPDRARQFVTDRIEQELVDHRWALLHDIAAKCGGPVGTALLRGEAPAIALVREVMIGQYDLLIRSHGVRDASMPFGPIDMQLLRKCPCPVWLAGPSARPKPRRIMAAVDAGSTEPGEAALNQAILDIAVTIRDIEAAHLTVVYAWSAFGYEFLQRRMSATELAAFMDATRAAATLDLGRAISALGARKAGVEFMAVEGEPFDVLPTYAESHSMDLVVMGTVARTGLAGFIMGNTAERILSRLRGSVLAVKPAGFVSPVKPNAT